MSTKAIIAALTAASLGGLTADAQASKIEKVDMVKEGINLSSIVVRANSGGYTGYETSSYRFMVRVFAKAKGLNHIFWAAVSTAHNDHPMVVRNGRFFSQTAAMGSDGWGVYKKSLVFNAAPANMAWVVSPKQLCDSNLNAALANGKSKADVLKKEWQMTAQAKFYFSAAADSKSHIKKRKYSFTSVSNASKGILYPVPVLCRKGM